jgi:probable HAF family extracellular repeat protein
MLSIEWRSDPMNARPLALIVAPALLMSGLAAPEAQSQTFTGLGFLPGGAQSAAVRASADGSVVVGSSGSYRAFLWTRAGGMVDLGMLPGATTAYSTDVSDDGLVVVGAVYATEGPRAFRWTSAGGMVSLGLPLDGGGDQQAYSSYGTAVSGDGAVVAGFSDPVNDAFRWTDAGGMLSLGTLGAGYSIARDCNSDGTVVVGESTGGLDDHAFRWTPQEGLQDLGTMPGGTSSHAAGVSADGSTVVGYGGTSGFTGVRAFRWTSAGGMVGLGAPSGMASRAYGVSGDGTVVVGIITSPDHAMLWTPSLGMLDLNTYLPSLQLDLTGWTLTTANGVSLDGRTIVGTGTHNGQTEAWVAQLPSSTAIPLPPRHRGTRSHPVVPESVHGGAQLVAPTVRTTARPVS